MGAADVVPFIPVAGCTMDDCIALARSLGERIGKELEIPVFLYARAAARRARERLPDVRKGEFEGLSDLVGTDPDHDPDFGPRRMHPTAGATAVGARPSLVAYNIYLKHADEALAKAIAKQVRASSGGLAAVQAMGMVVGGEPQVSMNLLDIDTTPMHVVSSTPWLPPHAEPVPTSRGARSSGSSPNGQCTDLPSRTSGCASRCASTSFL